MVCCFNRNGGGTGLATVLKSLIYISMTNELIINRELMNEVGKDGLVFEDVHTHTHTLYPPVQFSSLRSDSVKMLNKVWKKCCHLNKVCYLYWSHLLRGLRYEKKQTQLH